MRAVSPTVVAAAAAGVLGGVVILVSWKRRLRLLSYKVERQIQRTQLVVVVGVGGVGSHAAHLLLRGGISRFRLVDFDQLTLSSLNRHATGTRAAVGKPKVVALRDALLQICPSADIDARSSLFSLANASEMLEGTPDLVVDAIDDLATKAELLEYCVQNGLPVISALGAGGKAHACQLHLVCLSEVNADAIATTLMKNVRKTQELHGTSAGTSESFASWPEKVVCVACSETQRVGLLPLPEGVSKASELGAQPNFRVRVMPVLPPMPAAFGAALAAHGLARLDGRRVPPPPPVPPLTPAYQRKLYLKFHKDVLRHQHAQRPGVAARGEWPISVDEVSTLVCDVFRCHCALSGMALQDPSRPHFCLCLYDATKPPTLPNVLFATVDAAAAHATRGIQKLDVQIRQRIDDSFETALRGQQASIFQSVLASKK